MYYVYSDDQLSTTFFIASEAGQCVAEGFYSEEEAVEWGEANGYPVE